MPLTNPWLAGPAPDRELPRVVLEERILNLLSTNNVAVIATMNGDGSPVAPQCATSASVSRSSTRAGTSR